MGHHTPHPRQPDIEHQRTHRERGSAAVETAIALPLVFFVLLGVIQGGALLRSYSGASNAARVAARTAAIAGADPMADQRILARIAEETGALATRTRSVVIWHAAGPDDTAPAGCRLAPGSAPSTTSLGVAGVGTDPVGACNVYLNPDLPGGAFDMATGRSSRPASWYFGGQGAADPARSHLVDCRWPAKDRQALQSPRSAASAIRPDFVGVQVVMEHRVNAGGMPLRCVTIVQTTVTLLEPKAYALT
jgi:hypothetical protein